jgi:hypothetical protein
MERTESKIVETAPQDENDVIQNLQSFGWNLQNRQELRFEGNSRTTPDMLSGFGGIESSTTTTEIHHYVKLHFVRSMNIPNLDEIHDLENEYFNLSIPDKPKLFPVGLWLWIILSLIYGIVLVIYAIYYLLSYKPSLEKWNMYARATIKRANEIEQEIPVLLQG